MKKYPSIDACDHPNQLDGYFYAFDKLDGSNIRADWSRKNGFYKFGSRKVLIDESTKILGESVGLIKAGWENELDDIFRKERYEQATAFFEFYGEHSAFGQHSENELHKVSLIDVSVYKHGLLLPKDFLNLFGNLDIAQLLYDGNIDFDFVNKVKNSELEGMTFEGVVCKKGSKKKKFSKTEMTKIKSDAWKEKLKEYCKGDEKLYQKLL